MGFEPTNHSLGPRAANSSHILVDRDLNYTRAEKLGFILNMGSYKSASLKKPNPKLLNSRGL